MLGIEWDDVRGLQIKRPLRVTLFVLTITLFGVLWLYVSIGCGKDWVVLGGIILDIVGALGLAVLDIPSLAFHCYADRLRNLWSDFLGEGAPQLDPQRIRRLVDVLSLDLSLPSEPEAHIESRDDGKDMLVILVSDGAPDSIPLEIVQQRLRQKTKIETDRMRRIGAYLLISGFILQFLGLFFESTVVLRLIEKGLRALEFTVTIC